MILITTLILIFSISGYIQIREAKIEKKIVNLSEEYLHEIYHETEFEVEVKWMPPALKKLTDSEVEEIRFQNRELPRGLVSAEAMTERGIYPIQLYIRVTLNLPVAESRLLKGDEFGPEELQTKKADVTSLKELPLLVLDNSTWIANRDIEPGEFIYDRDIVKGNILRRGQQVTMIYDEENLTIEMSCEIRQPASPGEVTILRCSDTGKRYEAILNENKKASWIKTL